MLGVAQQGRVPCPPGWISTSSAGASLEGVVRAEDQVLGAGDMRAVAGQARDRPAVFGVLLGPVREDLPRADRVQFLDPVEEQDPDVPPVGRPTPRS